MTYPIQHISYSSLALWQGCSWCWREKYINHRPQEPSEALRLGKLVHDNADNYHRGLNYDSTLLKPYTDKYGVSYRKVSEMRFKLMLMGFDIPFLGYIDSLREGEVTDLKYSKQVPTLKKSIQGILYSAVYKHINGEFPLFTINHWNKVTNKIRNHSTTYTNKDVEWLEELVTKFLDNIKDGHRMRVDCNSYYPFHSPTCPFK